MGKKPKTYLIDDPLCRYRYGRYNYNWHCFGHTYEGVTKGDEVTIQGKKYTVCRFEWKQPQDDNPQVLLKPFGCLCHINMPWKTFQKEMKGTHEQKIEIYTKVVVDGKTIMEKTVNIVKDVKNCELV